jgi:NADPH:quinone reductase-like Zn-dependent oxidoreductase
MTLTEVVLPGVVPPEGVEVRTRSVPVPGVGEVLVAVEATGVSFAERAMLRGRYYDQPKFPFVPGYDLVGVIAAVGPQVDPAVVGTRVAALTKVGGWTTHAVVRFDEAVTVPSGLTPVQAECLVVNGITAWRMLHGKAKVRAGQTVLVHGATSGVGSILVQLAMAAGARVIGTAKVERHEDLRAIGVVPVDSRGGDVPGRVLAVAPGGVAAVFDHVGGPGLVDSWKLVARGGVLVSYGNASSIDSQGSAWGPVLETLPRVWAWNLLPNGRRAYFFNVWAWKSLRPQWFRARLREDLAALFAAGQRGDVVAKVGAELPLAEAGKALRMAENRSVEGKIVLIP